jgi:hypothetical protein
VRPHQPPPHHQRQPQVRLGMVHGPAVTVSLHAVEGTLLQTGTTLHR